MKLIIDIPEERYKEIVDEQWLPNRLGIEKAIANGIPLDGVLQEIRQEITNLVKTYPFTDHMDAYVKEDEVLEIIDKHIKGGD